MSKEKEVIRWVYRIICFTILQSLIITIGFIGLHYSMTILTEMNLLTWKVQIGLIQVALAICYLQVVNIFYWIMGINLFNFKKLWTKQKND